MTHRKLLVGTEHNLAELPEWARDVLPAEVAQRRMLEKACDHLTELVKTERQRRQQAEAEVEARDLLHREKLGRALAETERLRGQLLAAEAELYANQTREDTFA